MNRNTLPSPEPSVGMGELERIGRDRDIIFEAINEYDGWLLDDDYDVRGCLDRIIERMRSRVALSPSSEYVMVPREPTEAMLNAVTREFGFSDGYKSSASLVAPRVWRAMISAHEGKGEGLRCQSAAASPSGCAAGDAQKKSEGDS